MSQNRYAQPLLGAAGARRTVCIFLVQMILKMTAKNPAPGSKASCGHCCDGQESLYLIQIFRTGAESVPKPGKGTYSGAFHSQPSMLSPEQLFSAVAVDRLKGQQKASRKRCRKPAAAYAMSGVDVQFSRVQRHFEYAPLSDPLHLYALGTARHRSQTISSCRQRPESCETGDLCTRVSGCPARMAKGILSGASNQPPSELCQKPVSGFRRAEVSNPHFSYRSARVACSWNSLVKAHRIALWPGFRKLGDL